VRSISNRGSRVIGPLSRSYFRTQEVGNEAGWVESKWIPCRVNVVPRRMRPSIGNSIKSEIKFGGEDRCCSLGPIEERPGHNSLPTTPGFRIFFGSNWASTKLRHSSC
jgi:hypothetical protein